MRARLNVATRVTAPPRAHAREADFRERGRMLSDTEDILLTIAHPQGDCEISLAEWIRTGPGDRKYLQPSSARRKSTGSAISLIQIPLQYRNTRLARLLIGLRLLRDPWRS